MATKAEFNQALEDELMNFLTKNFGFEVFTPGLLRTRPIYENFIKDFKEKGIVVITIAGTNGKGQTAHTLGGLLAQEKRNFALWTSPHILSLRERFTFGQEGHVEDVSILELKDALLSCEKSLRVNHPEVKISFYEFLFYVFLHLVAKRNISYLILEVGLGGRLDAVNHFDAAISCITSISRDHQAILGSRLEQILMEKIAVAKTSSILITNFKLAYLNERVSEYVHREKVDWQVMAKTKGGNYFLENQKMAWEIFNLLNPKNILDFENAMRNLPVYKGRREIMTFKGKSLIFIGAHNIDGVRRMLEEFEHHFADQKKGNPGVPNSVLLSFSQRPENEVFVMLKSMTEFFAGHASVSLTSFAHPKALSLEVIQKIANEVNKGMLNFVPDWKAFLQNDSAEESTILVCGSYYFIGEVQRFINR